MTQQQLIAVMIYHLKNFDKNGVEVNAQTILGSILNDDDGFGAATSKRIFKSLH